MENEYPLKEFSLFLIFVGKQSVPNPDIRAGQHAHDHINLLPSQKKGPDCKNADLRYIR